MKMISMVSKSLFCYQIILILFKYSCIAVTLPFTGTWSLYFCHFNNR